MHHFFVPPEASQDPEITLPEAEAHHAVQVLRLRPGDRVGVLNGIGDDLLGEVLVADRRTVRLRIIQRAHRAPLPCPLTLVQAVAKPKAMEFIVQKATELGVHRIVPVLSERTVVDWDPETSAHKAARWRAAAVEAAKQCGTPWLPAIESPVPVPALLAHPALSELVLVASLQAGARHPRLPLENFRAEQGRFPRSLAVWVGPEGDFTPAEMNAIVSAGALPITLGPLVLRSETAALCCLSILNYERHAPPSTATPATAPPASGDTRGGPAAS